jgi:hypothetical protein
MSGLFFPKPAKVDTTPAVQAQSPIAPADRSSEDAASLAAEQRNRFTRRKGRAYTMLSGGNTTGGTSASRMLGAVART